MNDSTELSERMISRFVRPEILNVLLAAIATSIAIATFFGLQGDRTKKIEVAYSSKLSLVSPDAVSDSGVEVLFQGRTINNLTKISARLSNSGNLPIEERDIEQPISIPFQQGKVKILKAIITELRPSNLAAEILIGSQADVIIKHRLLNPGDYIVFEVLLDGIPVELPAPIYRISGVSQVSLRLPESTPLSYSAAFLPVPRYLEYLIVVLGSILSILVAFVFLFLAKDVLETLFFSRRRLLLTLEKASKRETILLHIRSKLDDVEGLKVSSVISPRWEWFDNPQLIEDFIASEEWKKRTARLSSSGKAIADGIVRNTSAHFKDAVGWTFFLGLPGPFGRIAQQVVESIVYDHRYTVAAEFLDIARDSVKGKISSLSLVERWKLIEGGNVAAVLIMLSMVPASILLVLGSWRILLVAPH